MLSAKDIHFAINNRLTLNSSDTRNYESEELDDIINTKVIQLINDITSKKIKDRSDIEESIIRGNKKTHYTVPTKDGKEWTFTLPTDYLSTTSAKATLYSTSCISKVTKIEPKKIYKAKGKVKYNGVWYDNCDIIYGSNITTYYGEVEKLDSASIPAIDVDYKVYDITNLKYRPVYTIEGNTVKIKSKTPLYDFYFTYFGQFSNEDKIDYCNNQTLNFQENIQRYIIERVVIDLANIVEESQQKIVNFKSEIE